MIKKFIILIMMLFSVSTVYASSGSAKKVYRTDAELQSAIDSARNGEVIDLRATIDAGISFGTLNIRSKNIEFSGYNDRNKPLIINSIELDNSILSLRNLSIKQSVAGRFFSVTGTSDIKIHSQIYFDIDEFAYLKKDSDFTITPTTSESRITVNNFKIYTSNQNTNLIKSFSIKENPRGLSTPIEAETIFITLNGGTSEISGVSFKATKQQSRILEVANGGVLNIQNSSIEAYITARYFSYSGSSLFSVTGANSALTLKDMGVIITISGSRTQPFSLFNFSQYGINYITLDGGGWCIVNKQSTRINLAEKSNTSHSTLRFTTNPIYFVSNGVEFNDAYLNTSDSVKYLEISGSPSISNDEILTLNNFTGTATNLSYNTSKDFNLPSKNRLFDASDMIVDLVITNMFNLTGSDNIGIRSKNDNIYKIAENTSSPIIGLISPTSRKQKFFIDPTNPSMLSTYKIVGNGGKVNNLDEFFSTEKLFEGKTPTTSVIDGLTFARDGYTPNNIDALKTTVLRQGLNLLNVNWTPNTYNINYEVDGAITTQQVTYDSTFNLNVPTKTGYTFDKWYTDSGFTTEYVKPSNWTSTADINLYGKWTPNIYNINYEVDGANTTQEVEFNSIFDLENPTKAGYTFDKWYTDSRFTTEYVKPSNWTGTADINLYGKYTPNNYNATFKEQNGNIIDTKIATYDSVLADVPTFTKVGYQFKGWTDVKMNSIIDFTKNWTFAEDKEFYPVFAVNKHLVEFVYNQDLLDEHIKILLVDYGNKIVEPFIKTKVGYKVEGIYKDDKFTQLFDFNENIQSDMKLYVNIVPKKYKIKYVLNGGKLPINKKETVYNTAYELDIPTKDGYNFAGWFKENTFKTVVENKGIWTLDSDINLYAKWVKSLVPGVPDKPSVQPDLPTTLPSVDGGSPGGSSSGQNNLDKDKDKNTEKDENNKNVDKIKDKVEATNNGDKVEKFEDIENHWAKDKIKYLTNLGIISGYEGKFKPNDFISRGDISVIVSKLLNLRGNKVNNLDFKDVSSDKYYYKYIDLAVENGILQGYGDNIFKPKNHITREEFIVIIDRVLSYLKLDNLEDESKEFKDYERVSKWAISSFDRVNKTGIISGDGNKMFNAKENITRAEVVTFIYNVIDKFYGVEK